MYTQESNAHSFYDDAPRKGPLPRGKIIMIICAAAALALTVGITMFSPGYGNSTSSKVGYSGF
jgi:hypothetical protein